MRLVWLLSLVGIIAVLAACGANEPAAQNASSFGSVAAAAPASSALSSTLDAPLIVEAVNKDRQVQAGSDETFDFKVVNNTAGSLPVVVVLDHAGGKRWKTSLCVGKQCLLGDGSKPTVSDVVVLPPYLEQPFQAHVFVDAAARPGQQTALTLRVEPLVDTTLSRSVTLSAQVSQP